MKILPVTLFVTMIDKISHQLLQLLSQHIEYVYKFNGIEHAVR